MKRIPRRGGAVWLPQAVRRDIDIHSYRLAMDCEKKKPLFIFFERFKAVATHVSKLKVCWHLFATCMTHNVLTACHRLRAQKTGCKALERPGVSPRVVVGLD